MISMCILHSRGPFCSLLFIVFSRAPLSLLSPGLIFSDIAGWKDWVGWRVGGREGGNQRGGVIGRFCNKAVG